MDVLIKYRDDRLNVHYLEWHNRWDEWTAYVYPLVKSVQRVSSASVRITNTKPSYIWKSLPTSSLVMRPETIISGAAWRSTMRRLRSRFENGPRVYCKVPRSVSQADVSPRTVMGRTRLEIRRAGDADLGEVLVRLALLSRPCEVPPAE